MMELEKGMYVKTKDSGILKIRNRNYIQHDKFWSCERYDKELYSSYIDESEILKASHNIIDLIEVGDIVNGYTVAFLESQECDGECFDFNGVPIICKGDRVETILTKEQYEKYAYKVKG